MLEAKVNLLQLAQNIKVVRQQARKGLKILFVVKADGYGHGIAAVSRIAEKAEVDYLGISSILEAKKLNEAAIKLPVLLFGPFPKKHIKEVVKTGVHVTIANTDASFVKALNRESKFQDVHTSIQVKVDTGLGRTGILPNEAVSFFKKLQDFSYLQVEGIYSHFSVAESANSSDKKYTLDQIQEFRQILQDLKHENMLPSLCHIANSAGFIRYQDKVTESPLNMVRLGTLLYGYPEVRRPWVNAIKPSMSLFTKVIDIRKLSSGSYISYGRTYRASAAQKIAILPAGYRDGLDRRLSNIGAVIVNQQRAPIVGKICANHTMVNVSNIPNVRVGDNVELMGEHLPASELAQKIGASILEILAPFAERDIERVYMS